MSCGPRRCRRSCRVTRRLPSSLPVGRGRRNSSTNSTWPATLLHPRAPTSLAQCSCPPPSFVCESSRIRPPSCRLQRRTWGLSNRSAHASAGSLLRPPTKTFGAVCLTAAGTLERAGRLVMQNSFAESQERQRLRALLGISHWILHR